MRRLLPLLLLALPASDAHAAVVTGAVTDPEGDAPAPQVDVVSAGWTFDDAAGKVTLTVTLKGIPDAENWGVINAGVRTACEGGTEFATIRVNSRTTQAGGGGAGSAEDGPQPDGSTGPSYAATTNVKSDEGRTTTAEFTHARLVGRQGGCVRITLSHNGVLDSVTVPAQQATGEPTPPPAPPAGPGTPPPPPPAATAGPQDVRLGSGRRLRFRSHKTGVGLTGVVQGMAIRVSLRAANGTTLAGNKYVAKVTAPPLVPLKLNARGRRFRGRKAFLFVRTSYRGELFQRRYSVRLSKTS